MPSHNRPTASPGCFSAVTVALLLRLLHPQRAQGEDRVDIKYERYEEERGRIAVNTTSVLFDIGLSTTLSLRGHATYDGISGATPTGKATTDANGRPAPIGEVETVHLEETRYAGNVELSQKIGRWTVSPQVSYSTESDYDSLGVALNQTLDFNTKNTTVAFGLSHNFDRVLDAGTLARPREYQDKDTTEGLIGVTQLLGPRTVLTANFTLSYADGYLDDPYRVISTRRSAASSVGGTVGETRPRHKAAEIGFVSLTQYLTGIDASAELSYRIYTDSYGIWSHTGQVEWFQKLGRRVILAPFVRYYTQTAADFYMTSVVFARPTIINPNPPPPPPYFSADYRLSALHSWTMGLKATITLRDNLRMDLGYQRYQMRGDDSVTPASAYPDANIFTIGGSLSF